MTKGFVIAAPWSNSGKTTFTLALCRLLSRKGIKVQPFKCGPDYIDTLHHGRAAGRTGINLDSFMMSDQHVQETFSQYAGEADVAVVEGVMGLFDGAIKTEGSTAEIARLLNMPVILVMDASAMGYSVAPLLHGLKTFDPQVQIAGVVFNFIHTEAHYAFLKAACEDVGLKALGYLPPNDDIKIPSRHLGLFVEENFEECIHKAADHVEQHINVEQLLACGRRLPEAENKEQKQLPLQAKQQLFEQKKQQHPEGGYHDKQQPAEQDKEQLFEPQKATGEKTMQQLRKYKIAVARDEVFSFTYFQNLQKFRELGEVCYFSPLHDSTLPEADLLYLAGGYPELHLQQLSENIAMKQAITAFAKKGGWIIAECGGMMYLGQHIIDEQGNTFPMAGIFGFSTSMQNKKLSLGYRKAEVSGLVLKGHEFRYSSLVDLVPLPSSSDPDSSSSSQHLQSVENLEGVGNQKEEGKDIRASGAAVHELKDAKVLSARGHEVETKIYRCQNVLASYIHFYWGEEEQLQGIMDYLAP